MRVLPEESFSRGVRVSSRFPEENVGIFGSSEELVVMVVVFRDKPECIPNLSSIHTVSPGGLLLMMLLFFIFSVVLVPNLNYLPCLHGDQSRLWFAEQGK